MQFIMIIFVRIVVNISIDTYWFTNDFSIQKVDSFILSTTFSQYFISFNNQA